ncbi:PTS sugar transporter subunit IIC [Lactobacillus sp. XV13L]|nr:PTS sugar transporter subunit IIC [Lactobacillus sp. XV13L]
MIELAVKLVLKIRKSAFLQSAQRTLAILMPLAVIGSYFKLLGDLFFSANGLIYNILSLDKVMSDYVWYSGSFVCHGMVEITFGVFGLYTSYFMACYTAQMYHKDSTMAGLSAVLIMLFCTYALSSDRGARELLASSLLEVNAVFIALLVGFGVGQVFRWLGKNYYSVQSEPTKWLQYRAWNAAQPLTVSLAVGIFLGIIIYELQLKMHNSASFSELVSRIQTTNNLAEVLLLSLVVTFLNWLGIGYPLSSLAGTSNNAFTAENLTAALQHGSSWHVPYQFLGSSLINSYGVMGGASCVLALIVLILLRKSNLEIGACARANLLPAAFGSTLGFAIGLPLILNPVFMVPCSLIPLINMTLAAGAIGLHLIPVCAYPILKGTPGILISFLGTNGNWRALLFTISLFLLDLLLLWPVVKVNERVEVELSCRQMGESNA